MDQSCQQQQLGGYFLLLVDDLSRYMWNTLLNTKDEVENVIKCFQAEAEVEAKTKLRVLRTDRDGEFTSCALNKYCVELGIKCHLTAPYSP